MIQKKDLDVLVEIVLCLAAIVALALVIRWTVGTGLGQW